MRLNFKAIAAMAAIAFFASLLVFDQVYASLTVAFVLAYLLDPVVGKLDKHGLARRWAVPLTLIVFFVLLTLAGAVVIPKILAQGRELLLRLPKVYYGIASALGPSSERYLGYNVFHDVDTLLTSFGEPSQLMKPIGGVVGGVVGNVFTTTFRFVTALLGALIIPLIAYYLLIDFPHLYGKFLYVVPKRHHKMLSEIRTRLHGVLGGFIRGQLVVSTILSAYYCAAFAVLRLELALVLGLLAGFFNIIPYLGIISVLVLTLLIAFIHGAPLPTYLGIALVYAVGMGFEGSFLTPRIVGRRVGLGPLTLILALLVGGQLLGLAGMLLAVPLAAVGKVFVNVILEKYRGSDAFNRA